MDANGPTVGPIPGVGAVIVDRGALLLVRRGRGPGQGLWAVPGGKVRFGETQRQAVIREVREETGLEIEPGEVVWVGDSLGPGDPPAWHFTLVDFAARVVGGDATAGDDALAVEWVPLDEVLDRPVTPTMIELVRLLEKDGRRQTAATRKTADGSKTEGGQMEVSP
jgi:ADP-ribose pyrophosphatase YjhB (NUDIX family)